MKIIHLIISIFILFFMCFFNHCDIISSSTDEIDENYPTKLYPLTTEEWQQLQNEFDALNDSLILTQLNEYGFTGERDYSKIHPNPKIKIDESTALNIAVEFILKNNKFTNVIDSVEFINSLNMTTLLEDDSTEWRMKFGPQIYEGYEIQYSDITIFLYGDGVNKIYDSWYPNIYIPNNDNYDIDDAKKEIINQSITWYDIDGKPNEFIVSRESIMTPITKSIYPLEQESSLEFRVVWKIPIQFGSFVGWHIYLDTSTEEIVAIIQEFRT